jgi:hypothetical protein
MSRRKPKSNQMVRSSGKPTGITRQTFRFTAVCGMSATGQAFTFLEVPLSPAQFGDRGVAFQDMFAEWRCVALRSKHFCLTSQDTGGTVFLNSIRHGVFYSQLTTAEYAAPTSYVQLADFPNLHIDSDLRPINFNLALSDLQMDSPYKWLRTKTTGTTETSLTQCGTLTYFTLPNYTNSVGATAEALRAFVEVDCEFKGPIDTALNLSGHRPGMLLPRVRELKTDEPLTPRDYYLADDRKNVCPPMSRPASPRRCVTVPPLVRASR